MKNIVNLKDAFCKQGAISFKEIFDGIVVADIDNVFATASESL